MLTFEGDRGDIIEACERLNSTGLNQGSSGNISVYKDGTFLITPTSLAYDTMMPGDIVQLNVQDGLDPVNTRKPSSEWRFHRDIYRARPDVGAIVHCHAPYATALSMLRKSIPAVHYMIVIFGGNEVRCAPYATFGTDELSSNVVGAIGQGWGCLMANHGMLACGETRHFPSGYRVFRL